jgi:hypothetical protein
MFGAGHPGLLCSTCFLPSPTAFPSTMSCCGQSRKNPEQNNSNPEKPLANGYVNQQPPMHSGMVGGTPMHHPQPSHPTSPPLTYQPNRQSSYGPPSAHPSQQYNAMGGPMNQFGQFGSPGTTLIDQPVHGKDPTTSSFRASTVSPPLMTAYPNGGTMSQLTMGMSATPQIVSYAQPPTIEEGKMSVSIDFGTTFSGVVSFSCYCCLVGG